MMNQNSPSNNMGGMLNIPPNPIGNIGMGNIINLGGTGYNNNVVGSYYNGMYNGYYNPYLIQRQKEIDEARLKEESKQQSNIWKRLSIDSNKILGTSDDIDEHLKRYDPVAIEEQQNEEQQYSKLVSLANNGGGSNRFQNYVDNHNRMFDQEKQARPDDLSLAEYLATAGELYVDALESDHKDKLRDVGRLYNTNEFQQLIDVHNKVNRFKDANIDDNEITLPNHLATEFQQRKQLFLDTILR